MTGKKIGDIYETRDYGMFKHLDGNRTDSAKRGSKIVESIRKVGYVLSPIAVNENYEVIDGQGRLYALELEGLPVHYYIVPGADIDDCIAMNIYGTKWKVLDYINSYAERGNMNYISLLHIMDQYPQFGLKTIIYAITLNQYGSNVKIPVENGKLIITEDDYKNAVARLNYCKKVHQAVEKVNGRKDYLYYAIIFIYDHYSDNEIDKKKLLTRIELQYNQLPAIVDVVGALKGLSDIYNYKSRGEKVYFDVDYDKCVNRRCRNTEG